MIKGNISKGLQLPLDNSFLIVSYNTVTNEFHFNINMLKTHEFQNPILNIKRKQRDATQDLTFALIGFYTAVRESKENFRTFLLNPLADLPSTILHTGFTSN